MKNSLFFAVLLLSSSAFAAELWPEQIAGLSPKNIELVHATFPKFDPARLGQFNLIEVTDPKYDTTIAYYGERNILTDIEDGGICQLTIMKLVARLGQVTSAEFIAPGDCPPEVKSPTYGIHD